MQGLGGRIDFLNLAVGDLQNAVRQEVSDEKMGIALARVVSRVFCVAEHFQDLPVVEAVVVKYGSGCGYCGQSKCDCPDKRPEADFGRIAPVAAGQGGQYSWTIEKWSAYLDELYGERNLERGIENVLLRLFKEESELRSLSMGVATGSFRGTLREIEWQFALELADSLAWAIGAANLLDIELEAALLDRYGDGCWNCRYDSCQCTAFVMEPVNWIEVLA